MFAVLALLLQAGLEMASGSPTGPHARGRAAYDRHQYAQSVQFFLDAVKREAPDSPEYQESVLLLGQSLYFQRDFAGAIPWLEKASAAGNRAPEAGYMLGTAAIQTGQRDKAVNAFALVFGVKPDSASAHVLTAQMMLHLQQERAADEEAAKALVLNARIPRAHFIRGEVAIYEGEIERAKEELRLELALDPTFAMAYYRLGDAHSRRDEWAEAIPLLERSIWLNPTYSGPYILLGKGYVKQKDFGNAEGVLRQALQMDPQNPSGHYLLGQTLMQSGKPEEGRKELARWEELRGKQ